MFVRAKAGIGPNLRRYAVNRKRNSALLVVVLIMVMIFTGGLFSKTVGRVFSSSKYSCSFSVPASNWMGNTQFTIAVVKDGLVEYLNTKTFSYITFSAYNARSSAKKSIDTFKSRIMARSSRLWPIRSSSYLINGIRGRKTEVGFVTRSGVTYNGIIVVLQRKKIEYRFFFCTMENKYPSAYREFLKIISTFRINP